MNKIYVGNLPYTIDDQGLSDIFSKFGSIDDVVVIKDRHSGRSKGFGFVTFSSADAANEAVKMDGEELDGRKLKVNMAREREEGGSRGGDRGGRGGRDW